VQVRRRKSGRPSKEVTASIEEQLLNESKTIFARKGYANTSLDEVATILKVSKHTIYRRFHGKEALFDAIVERDIRAFRDLIAGTDPEESNAMVLLRDAAKRYFEYAIVRENASFYLFVKTEAVVSPRVRKRLARWSTIALDPMREKIVAVQDTGALSYLDSTETLNLLVDLLEGVADRVRSGQARPLDTAHLFDTRWEVFVKSCR
jgi:AcrR family transcriptional regulator